MTVEFGWWFLLLQTFLLMLAAFLLGAMFACVLRRALYNLPESEQPAARTAVRLPPREPAPAVVSPQAAARPVAPLAPRPEPSRAPASTVQAMQPLPSGRQLDTSRFERALSSGAQLAAGAAASGEAAKPRPAAAPAQPSAAAPGTVPVVAASPLAAGGAAASVVAPAAATSGGPAAVAATVVAAAPPADDLTRISAIDPDLARALQAAGVASFQQIAGWTAADVAGLRQRLGLGQRIAREGWIEQASMLAKGQETHYSRRRKRGELSVAQRPAPPRPAPAAPPASRPAAPAPAASGPPKPAPAATPAPPAAPPAPRPAAPAPAAPAPAASAPPKPATAATPAPPTAPPAPRPATAAPAAPAPAAAARPVAAPAPPPAAPPPRDDLQRIRGVTPEIARLLEQNGVTRFAQIAAWTAADVARFDQMTGGTARIAHGNWIEQAQILAKGSMTSFSRRVEAQQRIAPPPPDPEPARPARLSDAIREQAGPAAQDARAGRPELAGLRSVRSEALVGEPAADAVRSTAARAGGAPDDLKRIRGIGVLIEKKLNSLGITGYDQIANWTGADIDRMSQLLDFRGRIERENWVEQARILASGGQTEFSRRVDKGDVESSRDQRG